MWERERGGQFVLFFPYFSTSERAFLELLSLVQTKMDECEGRCGGGGSRGVCAYVCVEVCVCDFSSKQGPEGPCEKPRGGLENRTPEKGSWKHGDLWSFFPPPSPPHTLLTPWSSCTQMCLHAHPLSSPPNPHHPCAPKLNATAKRRECHSW